MELENVKCPECNLDMIPKTSKFGAFWGCRNYPYCKGTRDSMGRSKEDREIELERDNPYGTGDE